LGFDFGQSGQLLPPPPEPNRRLEVIGDSITCGYGNEGDSPTCGFSAATENHYLTYGAIAARALGAELVTVAWSGKGVIYNYGDDQVEPLPTLYDRTLPDDPNSRFDFSLIPDAVVINLGTNDFSTDDDPAPDVFAAAYVDFVHQIRAMYPDAWILCTVAPLLSGQDLIDARAGIAAAVATLIGDGDSRVEAWEIDLENDDPGCDYHPSVATHQALAEALTEKLQSTLGW
jgi:lysophospholipase L1-like esterase